MNIVFDYFSISLLLGGFIALLSGLVVFAHNHRTVENIAWFLFNISSSVWSFGYFATINAPSHTFAYYSDWILHSAAILVPLFCLLSVISITKNYSKHKIPVTILGIAGLIFLISAPTNFFVRDVVPKANFNYVPDAGPLYIYFAGYFFLIVLYVLVLLYRAILVSKDNLEKKRLKFMLIFTAVGSIGGGSVFFLTFNVPFLPYPLILFPLFPLISIYAIFRLQLFDVKVITTEAIVFFLWIFILIRTIISESLSEIIVNAGLLVALVIGGTLLIRNVIKEVKLREQVEKLAEDLQKANLGQSNLIHFMNHQVKGRFGNAKNIFAELLTDDYGVMPKDAIPLLQKGLEETNMGVDYVQSILHGASAENGTLPYEMADMDMQELVETVFNKQKEYAEKKGLKISLNIEKGNYIIKGDSTQLSEAVKNLIDNSINYTMEGSIDVSLSSVDKVKLVIKDTGVGITSDDKQKLFKSGGRGSESLKINVNSTGYGLAFVKGVVEAHKGRVWAESDGRGKGSVFVLELPI
jgi:signal transduction histidine kinase